MQTLTLSCAAACLVFAGNALAADVPADLVGHSFKVGTDTSIHANMLRENRVLDDVSDGKGESIWPSTTAGGVLRCAMDAQNFNSDDAPAEAVSLRRAALRRLSTQFAERFARSVAMRQAAAQGLSDLQFTGAFRVPFQYSRYLRQHLQVGSFVQGADGVTVTDLDGNQFSDLTGSYGVNVFGHDLYKRVMAEGTARARSHGVLLGSYHPGVAAHVERLRAISGLDEVSFHLSGTEAVMQAVRLARYRTRKTHLVRFCGAHHGWWEDVQPGPGNPVKPRDTSTLTEMDADTLRVLRTRKDIAWCGVPPPGTMQAAAWNSGAVLGGCFAASHTRLRGPMPCSPAWASPWSTALPLTLAVRSRPTAPSPLASC